MGGAGLVLSRHRGARAQGPGLWAETRLPGRLRLGVLAHEIRKDIWRALRDLRGFAPVVELRPCAEESGVCVRAGGTVMLRPPAALQRRLEEVLEHPARRARWIAHSKRGLA